MSDRTCNNCSTPLDSDQYDQCPSCWLTGLLWEKFALDPVEQDLRNQNPPVFDEDTGRYVEDGQPYHATRRADDEAGTPY